MSTRTRKQSQDLKIKILLGLLVTFLIVVVGLIFLIINGVNKDSVVVDDPTRDPVQQVEQMNRTISGKSLEEDKKDVVEAVRVMLEEAAKNPSGKPDVMSQIDALEKEEKGVVTDALEKMIRMDGFDPVTENVRKVNTLQSLVAVANEIKDEKGKVNLISEDAWNQAFVDQKAGYALVPLRAFHSTGIFEFHMVYVDGRWQFAPKTFIDDVALFAQQSNSSKSSQ